jgi:hypothetical protein
MSKKKTAPLPQNIGWYAVVMNGGFKTQAWWSPRIKMWQLRDGGLYPPSAITYWQQL